MVMDCHKENKNKFKRCITPKAQHIWNMDTLRMHKHFQEMLSMKSKSWKLTLWNSNDIFVYSYFVFRAISFKYVRTIAMHLRFHILW